MPPVPKASRPKLRVYFRRKAELELIKRAARLVDRSGSAFVLDAALKEATRVIAAHEAKGESAA